MTFVAKQTRNIINFPIYDKECHRYKLFGKCEWGDLCDYKHVKKMYCKSCLFQSADSAQSHYNRLLQNKEDNDGYSTDDDICVCKKKEDTEKHDINDMYDYYWLDSKDHSIVA